MSFCRRFPVGKKFSRDIRQFLIFHSQHTSGERRYHIQIVGRHHNCRTAFPGNGPEQSHDIAARVGIQIARRLVGQDDRGCIQQRPGNHHTLLLAAREGVGHAVAFALHPHLPEYVPDPVVHFRLFGPPRCLEHKAEILFHRAVGEQLEILKDNT